MTVQEAKNLIVKTIPKGNSAIDIQLRGALDIAIEALENQDILLDLLVGFESSYICEEEMDAEWCEEHCKYSCPQKECYLQYVEVMKGKKNESTRIY